MNVEDAKKKDIRVDDVLYHDGVPVMVLSVNEDSVLVTEISKEETWCIYVVQKENLIKAQ